jgi:hypothetical protein
MDKDFKVLNPDWSRFWLFTYECDDATMTDPSDDTRVVQGEWVELAAGDKVVRTTDEAVLHFPVVDLVGQYDVQALNSVSVIKMGNFEVDTTVYDSATLTTLGQQFMIDVIAFGPGSNNRGIPTIWSASPDLLVGFVTRAPASSRIKLQTVCF